MNMELSEEEITRNQDIEIKLLLEAINDKYGYDFRNYSKAFLKRRLMGRLKKSNISSISCMQHKLLNEDEFFQTLIFDISLNVTDMYRDPRFFVALREKIIPILKTYPFLKIWHAGCSSGEEVYSFAIMLKEEDLLNRCIIYATDFNQAIVNKASEGIYPLERMKEYAENYYNSKGKKSFSDYFTVKYGSAIIDQGLKKNIVFSNHNLVSDGVFGEMNMIICRNVLIYFNRTLQNHVLKLFHASLVSGGVLCLGLKETLIFSELKDSFEALHKMNIYRKIYADD